MHFLPEGHLLSSPQNRAALESPAALAAAMEEQRILEAPALLCTPEHDLVVRLPGGLRGLIPREEGALGIREGAVRDIAVISRVNRPVCFVPLGFRKEDDGSLTAILSRRRAQELCREHYLSTLRPGDVIPARITHLESFGAFADIGCGVPSLLPIDFISVSRISHPRERFHVGMDIRAVVRSLQDGRVTLSHKELLGTWEENAARFQAGETVAGIVRSVEPYGVFVELTPNLAGLADHKEGVRSGQQASVFLKSILPRRMKIKLVIVETFDSPRDAAPDPPKYVFEGSHLDRFVYSPPGSDRLIETDFSPEGKESPLL